MSASKWEVREGWVRALSVGTTERVFCYREIEVGRKSGYLHTSYCRGDKHWSTERIERLLNWEGREGKLLIVRCKEQERVLCS